MLSRVLNIELLAGRIYLSFTFSTRCRHRQVQVPDRLGSRDLQQRQVVHEGRLGCVHRDPHQQVLQEGWLSID